MQITDLTYRLYGKIAYRDGSQGNFSIAYENGETITDSASETLEAFKQMSWYRSDDAGLDTNYIYYNLIQSMFTNNVNFITPLDGEYTIPQPTTQKTITSVSAVLSMIYTTSDEDTIEILVLLENGKANFMFYKSDFIVNLNDAIVNVATVTETALAGATNLVEYAKLLAQSLSTYVPFVSYYTNNYYWTYDGGVLVAEGSF